MIILSSRDDNCHRHHQHNHHKNPHLLEVVVDPSEQEFLVGELEDVGEGLARQAEHNQSVAVDGLPMTMVMVVTTTMIEKRSRIFKQKKVKSGNYTFQGRKEYKSENDIWIFQGT